MSKRNKEIQKSKYYMYASMICIAVFIVLTLISLIMLRFQVETVNEYEEEAYREYERHYALITNNTDDFWNSVYAGAKTYGEENGVYVEYFGENLAVDYTKEELFNIAVNAGVDGIILEADGKDRTTDMINEAIDDGMPIVTVLADSYGSKRQSYVGINSYNLGQEYGRQVLKNADDNTKSIIVLMNGEKDNTGQNIIYTAINETLEKEGENLRELEIKAVMIDNDTLFGAEETIRDIFMDSENLPDMIICLNEVNTTSTYQAVVDYNKVGEVTIIGYYDSETILRAIERDIISSTMAIDTEQMGELTVEALNEYIETGHVSDYISVDTTLVNAHNIKEYLPDEEQDME